MTAPRLLVFDLDGTLVPTMDDYADFAAKLMERHFGTPFAQARRDYFRTSGLPFEQQLRQLYPANSATDAIAQRFEAWKEDYLRNIDLPAETTAQLQAWRREGYGIAISSNNLETYVERVARDWPVDIALGFRAGDGQTPPFAKGEAHFRLLERRFGVSREAFLFIGDSPNDARIAKMGRVPFRALLTGHFTAADFESLVPGTRTITRIAEIVTANFPVAQG